MEVRFCIQQFNQEFLSLLDFAISPNIFERFVSSFGFPLKTWYLLFQEDQIREKGHI